MAWSRNSLFVHNESFHRNARRRRSTWRSLLSTLSVLCVLPSIAFAQSSAGCNGPTALDQMIASNPSSGAYEALGTWFAKRRQFSCAISAFESALRLDPKSWQSHYDLGITL